MQEKKPHEHIHRHETLEHTSLNAWLDNRNAIDQCWVCCVIVIVDWAKRVCVLWTNARTNVVRITWTVNTHGIILNSIYNIYNVIRHIISVSLYVSIQIYSHLYIQTQFDRRTFVCGWHLGWIYWMAFNSFNSFSHCFHTWTNFINIHIYVFFFWMCRSLNENQRYE